MADPALKQRLESITNDVVASAADLATAAENGTVASIAPTEAVGTVTADELKGVYKHRFAKLRAPGRVFYDKLITSAPNGKCPLCGHRDVATLDHFLPQTAHPALTVVPANLVPACSDCNKAKLDQTPTSPETVTLLPYFDNVEADEWLTGTVLESLPASVRFSVVPPQQWPDVLSRRVAHHFEVFGLAKLYTAQAAEELVNIRYDLERVFATEGAPGVTSHLSFMAQSRARAHINSWQTATYKAFAASEWFCGGGFAAT